MDQPEFQVVLQSEPYEVSENFMVALIKGEKETDKASIRLRNSDHMVSFLLMRWFKDHKLSKETVFRLRGEIDKIQEHLLEVAAEAKAQEAQD